eukprot:gb/GECH01000412.1/.p1 GENE.gb/GECH01000412.1/~~gb/GECH01000412.1/.p1  ORF type:complete len:159 (+),score=33.22 gb/GECH01000412.1/:1-477(+)
MPKLKLQAKALLENLDYVSIPDPLNYEWHLKIFCTNCQEACDNVVYFKSTDEHDMPGSRGTTNFLYKCKLCERRGSIDVTPEKEPSFNGEEFSTLATFECRGLDISEWVPTDGLTATTENGKIFDQVDLSEKEWYDYDEDAGEPVSVTEVESSLSKTK